MLISSWHSTQAQPDTLRLLAPQVALAAAPEAQLLEVDEEANLYLLDSQRSRLYKFFARYQYDSSIAIGGQGIAGEALNNPSQVTSAARNKLYVLDRGNRRVVLMSVNLREIRSYRFEQPIIGVNQEKYTRPIYPRALAVSPQGELYLLNGEDQQVLKFDTFGELSLTFGGLNYGEGSLMHPSQLLFDHENYVQPYLYVADTSRQLIQVFDIFGVYQFDLKPQTGFRWTRASLYRNQLVLFNQQHLARYNIANQQLAYLRLPDPIAVQDAVAHRNGIYVLSKKQVLLYTNHD
jgi:DNA-binding beta-propeller fold protein YncE